MKQIREALNRAVKRTRHFWAQARKQNKREQRVQTKLNRLHHDLAGVHKKLKEHPSSGALEAQRQALVGAIRRAGNRRDRRRYKRYVARQRAIFWTKKRTVLRKRYKVAKKKWDEEHKGEYEVWMLNGHSSNIDEDLKPVVAYLVAGLGQTITDTYDYRSHTPSSNHYPWNHSDNQGHAVDSGGPNMGSAMTQLKAHFGADKFTELFGPITWYIKYGATYQIYPYFPGHGDHIHSAVA